MGHDCGSSGLDVLLCVPVRCVHESVPSSHTLREFLPLGAIPRSLANFSHLVSVFGGGGLQIRA